MDITITVKGSILIDASPELKLLLQGSQPNRGPAIADIQTSNESLFADFGEKTELGAGIQKEQEDKLEREAPAVTMEEIRAVMIQVPKEEARALIQAYGVAKLTDIPEKNWPEVMASARAYLSTKEVA